MMFAKILIGLDGSSLAEQVLPHITEAAQQLHSQLLLLRVFSPLETVVPLNVPGQPAVPVRTEAAARRALDKENEATDYLKGVAARLAEKGLAVDYLALPGAPGETLLRYARENGIGLIAIATHGHGGFSRLAFGSTAEYVLHRSTIPVLVVNPAE